MLIIIIILCYCVIIILLNLNKLILMLYKSFLNYLLLKEIKLTEPGHL
jgi:hypothetical protein